MEILVSVLEYAARRKEEAIEEARRNGVEVDVIDENEEGDDSD